MGNAWKVVCILLLCSMAPAYAGAGEVLDLLLGGSLSEQKKKDDYQRRVDEVKQQREADRIELQRLRVERQAEEERKIEDALAEREARAVELKAGRVKPETIIDLEDLYDAGDGWDLAKGPMLAGDKELYVISGIVERHEAGMLLCATLPETGKYIGNYFAVRLKPNTKKPADLQTRLRINGRVFAVGRYVQNLPYNTVAAGQKIMPVLDAVHIIVPSN